MSEPKRLLLARGNTKLGENIYSFSLPAIDTCPGRSKLCEKACYATRGHIRLVAATGSYERKLERTKQKSFVRDMTDEIRLRGVRVVRIHVSGDFYSAAYIEKWIQIAEASRSVKFFVYTRSWRLPKLRKALDRLSKLSNFRLWYSCDKETGLPSKLTKRTRIAYMAVDDNDTPEAPPDLVFRVKRMTVKKRSSGALVCPTENGTKAEVTCQKCGLCWDSIKTKDPRRYALPLAG